MSRKTDLENLIVDSYSIIAQYNTIIQVSGSPDELLRSRRAVQSQWGLVKEYLLEYQTLVEAFPPEIAEIAAHFPEFQVPKPQTVTSILFLAADPTDTSRLRLGEELREIQINLQLAKLREQVELHQRMSVRPADISQALLDVQPQIVHFSGHGTATGALCFENRAGETHLVPPEALAALFEQFADRVKCVILIACYSETQAYAIAKHIDYVIGMNKAIDDKAAIAFAIGFYQAIGSGRAIEEAYELGCVQIRLQGIPEHLTPVLIKRGTARS